MKLTIEKRFEFVVDTSTERERIKKAFKNKKETQAKLNMLMDYVEAGDWQKAKAELNSEWWDGYDSKDECPRLEYIGIIKTDCPFIDRWTSWGTLILSMAELPQYYKLIKKD